MSGGALVAQLIALLLAPIITRLYSPSAFGALATFTAVVAVVATAAMGRYEMAVVLPDEGASGDAEAGHLARLALMLCVAVVVLLTVAVAGLFWLGSVPWQEELGPWLLLIPLAAGIVATRNLMIQLNTRFRSFKQIGAASIVGATVGNLGQVVMGLLNWGTAGLVLGFTASQQAGGLSLWRGIRRRMSWATPVNRGELRRVARKYRLFPTYELPFALANSLSLTLQVFLLGALYSPAVVGDYALVMKVVGIPAALVGTAVSGFLMKEVATVSGDISAAKNTIRRATLVMAGASIVPFAILAVSSVQLFPLVFGQEWAGAGLLAIAQLPLMWVRFFCSPISGALSIFGRQRQLLIWQAIVLLAMAGSFFAAAWLNLEPFWMLLLNSLLVAPLYLALIPMSLKSVEHGPLAQRGIDQDHRETTRRGR